MHKERAFLWTRLASAGLRALASAKGLTLVLVHHPLPTPRKIREMTIRTRITVAMVMRVLLIPSQLLGTVLLIEPFPEI